MDSRYKHRMHHNWQDNEIRELLRLRAQEPFRSQITGTVKDAVVFSTITRLLAQQGIHRSRDQVITKLKGLKKQYKHYRELSHGKNPALWPFYAEAERAFGDNQFPDQPEAPSPPTAPSGPVPVPVSAPVPNQAAELNQDEHEQVVVGLWDEVNQNQELNNQELNQQHHMNQDLAPVEDDEEEDYGSPEQPQSITYTVPTKKRKTTVMAQVNTMISATVAQLKEMDAAMQAQEDARLQRLMEHERDMQKNLMKEMLALHQSISRENHQRHTELVDKILSRLPSQQQQPSPGH